MPNQQKDKKPVTTSSSTIIVAWAVEDKSILNNARILKNLQICHSDAHFEGMRWKNLSDSSRVSLWGFLQNDNKPSFFKILM
jgi:hypothetical protein